MVFFPLRRISHVIISRAHTNAYKMLEGVGVQHDGGSLPQQLS